MLLSRKDICAFILGLFVFHFIITDLSSQVFPGLNFGKVTYFNRSEVTLDISPNMSARLDNPR